MLHGKEIEEEMRVRMGRFRDSEARLYESLFEIQLDAPPPRCSAPRAAAQAALINRARVAAGAARAVGRPILVKAVSAARSIDAIKSTLRYVGRLRADPDQSIDAPDIRDGAGDILPASKATKAVETWRDQALRLSPLDAAAGHVPCSERDDIILARHIVISIPPEGREVLSLDGFTRAVRRAVRDVFTLEGRDVLWVVHDDSDHLHAHLIVRSWSSFSGTRLRFDKGGLFFDTLRHVVCQHLAREGLPLDPTRRVDRPEIYERVLEGRAELVPSPTVPKRGQRGPDLKDLSPLWHVNVGADREVARFVPGSRRTGWLPVSLRDRSAVKALRALKPTPNRVLDELPAELRALVLGGFVDPTEAEASMTLFTVGAPRISLPGRTDSVQERRGRLDWMVRRAPELLAERIDSDPAALAGRTPPITPIFEHEAKWIQANARADVLLWLQTHIAWRRRILSNLLHLRRYLQDNWLEDRRSALEDVARRLLEKGLPLTHVGEALQRHRDDVAKASGLPSPRRPAKVRGR